MRKAIRNKWLKTGLVILTFLLVFLITYTLNRLYIKNNTEMVAVVVAAEKIPPFSLIKRESIMLAQRPRSVVPPEAVRGLDELSGGPKYYSGELGFGTGDIIRTDRLSGNNNTLVGNLARLTDENKMLVSVNTNLVKSCANFVGPGVYVNAVVFIKSDLLNMPDQIISPEEDPKLAGLLVVDKKNAESSPPPEKGREAVPATITLEIDRSSMEVAKALVQYNETGSIYLLPVGFKGEVYLAARAAGAD